MSTSAKQVFSFTSYHIARLLSLPDNAQKAALANLRRGLGHPPGSDPLVWGEFLLGMPEEMQSPTGEPSSAEWAVYTALTLFALHQQGHDPRREPMSMNGPSIGRAAAQLIRDEADQARIARRFNAFATSTDPAELGHHLRSLIQILKSEGIALDYPQLAADLYRYLSPLQADQVRLAWGRDFYSFRKKIETDSEREEISHE